MANKVKRMIERPAAPAALAQGNGPTAEVRLTELLCVPIAEEDAASDFDSGVTALGGRSCYLLASGCSRKNSHIRLVALMLRLVGPTNHSGIGMPPGQVWPPPSIV